MNHIIRENEVFGGADFTTSYMQNAGIQYTDSETSTGRYRYIEGGSTETTRYRNLDDCTNERSRFTGTKTALYAKGESVAINRSSSTDETGGRAYFGTDILGSVRSATTDSSTIEERYEYDAFGTPYEGDFSNELNNGYTGKPYDATTGLYNYGFRDYSPQTGRFTTVDPIRDGNNWFSYVVNDPVNYVDLWGLMGYAVDMGHGGGNENGADVYFLYTYQANSGKDQRMKKSELKIIQKEVAALEVAGLTVVVDEFATKTDVVNALADPQTQLVVISGHGRNEAIFRGADGKIIRPSDINKGENLDTVIFQLCNQGDYEKDWQNVLPDVDIVAWKGKTSDLETKLFNNSGFFDRQDSNLMDHVERVIESNMSNCTN